MMTLRPDAAPDLIAKLNDRRLGALTGRQGRITGACVALRLAADAEAGVATELLYGEPVFIQGQQGRFIELVNMIDLYRGFIPADQVSLDGRVPDVRVCVPTTPVYRAPSVKAPAIMRLSMGAKLVTTGRREDRFSETDAGWLVTHHIEPLSSREGDLVAVAEAWMGLPYLWGGRSANGLDCSALVQLSLERLGLFVLRDSDLQWHSAGDKISAEEPPRRGDLAFFPGHVGIMMDETHLLHANATRMAVSIDPLEDVIRWVQADMENGSDQPAFLGFRRPRFAGDRRS